MKELVVISGKGGTGKTSIVASFAALADKKVLADCDVDAADLHLILEPQIEHREEFRSGKKARIILDKCTGCGKCYEVCRFGAVRKGVRGQGLGVRDSGSLPNRDTDAAPSSVIPAQAGIHPPFYEIDAISCEGCGVCFHFCPDEAIAFEEQTCGEWFISRTRLGPMVHARLGIAEENSGKLVSLVRNQAKQVAEREGLDLMIVDGAPGIGCPVIASITGADLVLVVTEPTLSGLHDLERVRQLTRHFGIKTVVCINKFDLNEEIASEIAKYAESAGARVIGRVRYDNAVTKAQIMKVSVVEYTGGSVSQDIRSLWRHVVYALG